MKTSLSRPRHKTKQKKLLDLVGQCAQHAQSEDHRELAFIMLYELTETVGDVLTAHFDVLQGLFLQALKDPRYGPWLIDTSNSRHSLDFFVRSVSCVFEGLRTCMLFCITTHYRPQRMFFSCVVCTFCIVFRRRSLWCPPTPWFSPGWCHLGVSLPLVDADSGRPVTAQGNLLLSPRPAPNLTTSARFLKTRSLNRVHRPRTCACPSSPKVQVSALNACSALLAYLSMDDSGMKFRSLVQPCLQVSRLVGVIG